MGKIIEPPTLPLHADWKQIALFRSNARKLGNVGALMAQNGNCALLSLDDKQVGALLEMYSFNKLSEKVFSYRTPWRVFNEVVSADSLEAGSQSSSQYVDEDYTDGEIQVNVKDNTEFDVDWKVTVANPNNINLLLIIRAINDELARVVDGLPIYGIVNTDVINQWPNDTAPAAEPYKKFNTINIGSVYLSMRWERLKVQAFATMALPFVVAFPQGQVGKTLKLSLEISHSVQLATYEDPAANKSGDFKPENVVDWSLAFAPILGMWSNEWTLPLSVGEPTTLASGSHAVRAQTASELVSISFKVPASRLGVFFLRPDFTSGKNYYPLINTQIPLTNVTNGMTYDKYQQVKRQRFDYSVHLDATLLLDTATYS